MQQNTLNVSQNHDILLINNNSDRKIMIKSIAVHYYVSTFFGERRSSSTIKDEKEINRELEANEKLDIKLIIPDVQMVSITYIIDGRTFTDNIEL